MLESLTERERKVLQERFGVDFNKPDFSSIGDTYLTTRLKIIAIERKALSRLKGKGDPDDAA